MEESIPRSRSRVLISMIRDLPRKKSFDSRRLPSFPHCKYRYAILGSRGFLVIAVLMSDPSPISKMTAQRLIRTITTVFNMLLSFFLRLARER